MRKCHNLKPLQWPCGLVTTVPRTPLGEGARISRKCSPRTIGNERVNVQSRRARKVQATQSECSTGPVRETEEKVKIGPLFTGSHPLCPCLMSSIFAVGARESSTRTVISCGLDSIVRSCSRVPLQFLKVLYTTLTCAHL